MYTKHSAKIPILYLVQMPTFIHYLSYCIRNSWIQKAFTCDFLIWKRALDTDTFMLKPYPITCLKGLYRVYGTKNNIETSKVDCLLVFYLFVSFPVSVYCIVHIPWYCLYIKLSNLFVTDYFSFRKIILCVVKFCIWNVSYQCINTILDKPVLFKYVSDTMFILQVHIWERRWTLLGCKILGSQL